MERIQKSMIVQIILGFLLGRVGIFGLNPIGISYFAAGFTEGGSIFFVAAAIFLGMVSSMQIETAVCGAMVMLSLFLFTDILDKRGIHIKVGHAAIISSISSAVLWLIQLYITPYSSYNMFFAIFSSILIITFTRVFYDGIHFLLYHAGSQSPDNEEMISIVIIGALAVWGLPKLVVADISLFMVSLYFMILFMGYCFGMGAGAVSGAAAGIILTLKGEPSELIGIMSLLGICAGMFKSQGRRWMLSIFFVTAIALDYVLEDGFINLGRIKSVVIAEIIMFSIPADYIEKLCKAGNIVDKAGIQDMMKKRLDGFSNAFYKLSGALLEKTEDKFKMNNHDIRQMMNDMSLKVCSGCENSENCMGQIALCKPEIFDTFATAQEQGCIAPEQMPEDFLSECIHSDMFLSEANQTLRLVKSVMGFHNRMAESRRVMAGQMKEVGDMVQCLADDMPQIREFSIGVEEKILSALKGRRVIAEDIFAYTKQDGRLEISMQARTGRGRLVTSSEVARVLSQVLEKSICPSEESRNVLSTEMREFIFHEDTPLYTVTGVARAPRDGEKISGDTFSCISLPGGEFLMALSDGMGSGSEAMEESRTVIELLEQMTEAGFSHGSAIRLINSMYMTRETEECYATADIVVLNLFKSNMCFLKNGASATYLRHGDKVMMIEGQTLPVGVVSEIDSYMGKVEVSDGDYVIMMTDGVSDCFEGYGNTLSDYLKECDIVNPQEMAGHILDEAVRRNDGKIIDDMSVIVAGIWKRDKSHI